MGMDIKTFVSSTKKLERERIAALAKTTDAYFQQLAGGHRLPRSLSDFPSANLIK